MFHTPLPFPSPHRPFCFSLSAPLFIHSPAEHLDIRTDWMKGRLHPSINQADYEYWIIDTTTHLAVHSSAEKQETFGLFSLLNCVMKKLILWSGWQVICQSRTPIYLHTDCVPIQGLCLLTFLILKSNTIYMLNQKLIWFPGRQVWECLSRLGPWQTKDTRFKGRRPWIGTLYYWNWIPDWHCSCVLIFFHSGWPLRVLHQKKNPLGPKRFYPIRLQCKHKCLCDGW